MRGALNGTAPNAGIDTKRMHPGRQKRAKDPAAAAVTATADLRPALLWIRQISVTKTAWPTAQ